MNKLIEKALEAVLIAQKKLHEATTDIEAKTAEKELKKAQESLIVLEARLELLNSLGKANGFSNLQDAALSEEAVEKFIDLLIK